jgi:hypothetical protein
MGYSLRKGFGLVAPQKSGGVVPRTVWAAHKLGTANLHEDVAVSDKNKC